MKTLLLVAMTLVGVGCGEVWPDGGIYYGAYPDSLRVYIDPAVPAQPIMAGAAMWSEFISVKQVETPEQANAWVSATGDADCPDSGAGADLGVTVAASKIGL